MPYCIFLISIMSFFLLRTFSFSFQSCDTQPFLLNTLWSPKKHCQATEIWASVTFIKTAFPEQGGTGFNTADFKILSVWASCSLASGGSRGCPGWQVRVWLTRLIPPPQPGVGQPGACWGPPVLGIWHQPGDGLKPCRDISPYVGFRIRLSEGDQCQTWPWDYQEAFLQESYICLCSLSS